MELMQGNFTVQEYIMHFERLSQFAPHIVDTPEKKSEQYHKDVSLPLQKVTTVYVGQPFESFVGLTTQMENIEKQK